jgi:hypothetical protein
MLTELHRNTELFIAAAVNTSNPTIPSSIPPNSIHIVTFEAFMVVIMRNAVFWDIKSQFVLHRRHITSLLHRPAD